MSWGERGRVGGASWTCLGPLARVPGCPPPEREETEEAKPTHPSPYRVTARREGDGLHVVVGDDLSKRHTRSRLSWGQGTRARAGTRPGPQGGD